MEYKIFYSWQANLPNNLNRGFIEKALQKALVPIHKDKTIEVEPVLDRDTIGLPGTPDIADSILSKIEEAQIFVCDVSIVHESVEKKYFPNPNVLFELGYASGVLGWDRIIMVMNKAFGDPALLPFDLRNRRVLVYSVIESNPNLSEERNRLVKSFEAALRTIVEQPLQINSKARKLELDKQTFRKIRELLPYDGSIKFIRTFSFQSGSFELKNLDDIDSFLHEFSHNRSMLEFQDHELELMVRKLAEAMQEFQNYEVHHIFPVRMQGFYGVHPEMGQSDDSKKLHYYWEVTDKMDDLASEVVLLYDAFISLARKKLGDISPKAS
jgi:hypothetical protein